MSKSKDERLVYSVVGSVLTVSLPDESDSFSYDAATLRKFPAVLDKIIVHTVKKLLQERTSDADDPQSRFDGMKAVVESFNQGRFKAEPKLRQKLPPWLKGRVAEVMAIATLKRKPMDAIYTALEAAGEAQAKIIFASKPVQEQMARDAEATEVDLDDLK